MAVFGPLSIRFRSISVLARAVFDGMEGPLVHHALLLVGWRLCAESGLFNRNGMRRPPCNDGIVA